MQEGVQVPFSLYMSISRRNNNFSRFLFTVTVLAMIGVLVVGADAILNLRIKSGKYVNPSVASRVFAGTVYDRNKRPLSMSVPVYDEDANIVSVERAYPFNTLSAGLIREVEEKLSSMISPLPGFGETITHGYNVVLTVDMDIQYILDRVVKTVYFAQKPEFVTAFILDGTTGEVLAASDYDGTDNSSVCRSLLTEVEINGKMFRPVFIRGIEDYTGEPVSNSENPDPVKLGFTVDVASTLAMTDNDYPYSVREMLTENNSSYYAFIGSWEPENKDSAVLANAIRELQSALKIQIRVPL